MTQRKNKIKQLISKFQNSKKKWIKIKKLSKDEIEYAIQSVKYRLDYTTSIEVNSELCLINNNVLDVTRFKIISNTDNNYIHIRQNNSTCCIAENIKKDIKDELLEYMEDDILEYMEDDIF